jgi:hypothetical protein
MTPKIHALLMVAIFCAIVAAIGFHWATQEREGSARAAARKGVPNSAVGGSSALRAS